jgi:hypothetical protein
MYGFASIIAHIKYNQFFVLKIISYQKTESDAGIELHNLIKPIKKYYHISDSLKFSKQKQ